MDPEKVEENQPEKRVRPPRLVRAMLMGDGAPGDDEEGDKATEDDVVRGEGEDRLALNAGG